MRHAAARTVAVAAASCATLVAAALAPCCGATLHEAPVVRRLVIKITEIAFSCYPVTNMVRARAFYEGVLGLKQTHHSGEAGGTEWVEYDIANGTLSIGAGAPDWKPSANGCSVGLEVEDFDAAIAHLRASGVKFHMEPFPTPVCQMAFILDPDGNAICIHRRKAGHH